MLALSWYICTYLALFLGFGSGTGRGRQLNYQRSVGLYYPTITVDQSGHGNFSTIQSAIDSIPSYNEHWICVFVKAGEYREKVHIPYDKQFIYLRGEGRRRTFIVWSGEHSSVEDATFISQADNFVAKSISFNNSYNYPFPNSNPIRPAVAAMVSGNNSAFYRCGFFGFQDTLWDDQGLHYFKFCTIQGAVDFIFGAGQSIYEDCIISVVARDVSAGYITAQGRSSPSETNGFVFKNCKVHGDGLVFLGRPWRDYARVIFYNSSLSSIIVPQGWTTWGSQGHEYKLTFAENECSGVGSDTSKRVLWEAKLSSSMLSWFTSLSFIKGDDWISYQP